ncbi:acyl-CoA thioesterase [Bacillus sp. Marseille-P3661]|uniref:acyl-CoA thioesterase n=1 Tax=Bacillus sp. Marseille-P3661 TaxID=1936234 RepID=UPI000C81799A|nr:thioesterase family protein [Bacillus sp. Marseille-P3661]
MNVHKYHFRVEWGDTDAAGIVFSPNFYKFMDQAAHNFFETIGFPLSKLVRVDKIGIPSVESKCTFKKPLYHEDDVIIQTSISELRDKVIKFSHEFVKDGEVVAYGYQVRALASIGGERVKAISIPPDMRAAIIETGIIQQYSNQQQ